MNASTTNSLAAAEPPPGMVPNFAHPKDVYHTVDILVQGLSLVIMTGFFAIRVYVKMIVKRGETVLEDCKLMSAADASVYPLTSRQGFVEPLGSVYAMHGENN